MRGNKELILSIVNNSLVRQLLEENFINQEDLNFICSQVELLLKSVIDIRLFKDNIGTIRLPEEKSKQLFDEIINIIRMYSSRKTQPAWRPNKFHRLLTYYNEVDRGHINSQGQVDYWVLTLIGQKSYTFVPTPLLHLKPGLDTLLKQDIIDLPKWFLDAGCGDGRITALFGLYGNSIGIEGDTSIAQRALINISRLKNQGLFDKRVELAVDDYTKEKPYQDIGVPFNQIGTIYTFATDRELATKIAKESPKGTIYLVYHDNVKGDLQKLNHIKTLELSHPTITISMIDPKSNQRVKVLYKVQLQVYTKN